MKTYLLAGSFALVVCCLGQSARAAITLVDFTLGGQAASGATYVTFDAPPNSPTLPAGLTVTITPDAQYASGSSGGVYAAPFVSGNNNLYFGPLYDNVDNTQYLTAGSSSVELTFNAPQLYFGLLWGSVDTYNTLIFYDGLGNEIGRITGSDVINSLYYGNQGVDGTRYVNINADPGTPFFSVKAVSTQKAFEFDNVAYAGTPADPNAGTVAPEPGSMIVWSLLGSTICGACWTRRKRTA